MLIYDNGRFSFGNVSFKLPDGIGIDTGNEEICGQGFCLSALDESFTIQMDFKKSDNRACEEFSHVYDEEVSYVIAGEIEKVYIDRLEGYRAIYEDDDTFNEEYSFDLNNCGEYTILNIIIIIQKNCGTYDFNMQAPKKNSFRTLFRCFLVLCCLKSTVNFIFFCFFIYIFQFTLGNNNDENKNRRYICSNTKKCYFIP